MMETLNSLVNMFNNKIGKDERLHSELLGINKVINLDLGEEAYSFKLENGEAHSLTPGLIDNADVTISSDPETLRGLIERKIRPMKAYAQRKFRIKGEIEDLLKLRKLF
ncbi:MAG: hypothetical protein PWQ88_989 [Candidatus Methanomethylophilaceae archaeon]|nr:hypothetical protein [Candidatus Methanomethylophilaceae archaeon]MDI3541641.1 hypothetical protein [Candidatus Methanomethylophilaceae archaeon]HII99958.1 SCP2 sterol-binding domain-containing protein [Candidatus Methanomethylophilaceae archaeon]